MDTFALRKLPLIISTAIYSALTLNAGLAHSAGIRTDGGTATDVTTVNQVDIVNIATPTAGGISQNTFSRFSIDSNGAVMNNSTVDGASALAGQVQANPNLASGSAKIILNEVTSNRQSNLSGSTEIFGDNARYILSNPNGITCNGCGFIRTPTGAGDTGTTIQDVFLTTGTVTVNTTTGLPITFTVDTNNQSSIVIGQNGLDATNVDITTLLTRTAEINGIVDAASNTLNLYLGKGTLSVNDNAASSWTADTSNGRTVNVAIDATNAGAMYAGQIYIQATEDGAGVTLPDTLLSTGGISISAAGDIVYRDATAQAGDINVTATGTNTDITSTGSTIASANVTLSATGDVSYNNATAQAGDVTVTTTGTSTKITSTGSTTASANVALNGVDDVSYNNITAQAGNVTVTTQTATAQITTSGDTTAAGNITWNISGTQGRITGTGGAATFNAGSTLLFNCTVADGSCDIQSQRELILQASILQSNANIGTTSGNNLTVNAAVSTSQGFNSGANASFTSIAGDINIAGSLIAENNIELTSALNAQIILDGNVQAGGNIAFFGQGSYTHETGGTLGTFNIGGSYQFDLFSLTNNSILVDLQNGTLHVNQLTNNGLIENQAALNLQVDDTLINTGIIASLEGAVSIGHSVANQKTNTVTNSGVIASIDLTNSQLGQAGLILDPANLIDQHTQAILNGEQRSAEDLAEEIETQNAVLIAELNANATVTGVVSISANTLTNTATGRISGSDVSLLVDSLNNQGGLILAGRNLNVQGATLNNSNTTTQFGVLTARDNLNITLSSRFTNSGLVDGGNVTVNAPVQDNIGSGFSIASLLGAKLDATPQINPLAQKLWFEAGTGNSQYLFINAFNNTVIDSNLTRLSDAFIQSSGANIDSNNQMVGDDVYIAELLVNTLRSQGGVPFVTAERDALGQLNTLYNNTQSYMTQTGINFGEIPNTIQQSQITDPILVFVAQDQSNGNQVYVPQVWMPTSGEGINAQAGRINTQIIAANDLFLGGEYITVDDADLIAGENLVIEAVDFTVKGDERKWYVDATGKVHYRSSQIVAGDSVLVKLSGNYVQKGGQVLAANQLIVQAKSIAVSSKRKASFNQIESFNAEQGSSPQLWSKLLGLGLKRAGTKAKSESEDQDQHYDSSNMMAGSVLLKAEDDITLTRVDIRSVSSDRKDNQGNAGSLMLIADNGNIANRGSSLASDSIYMKAGKDITTESVQEVKNNRTIVNGAWRYAGWAYSDDMPTYSQTTTRSQYVTTDSAEVNAGKGGLVQIAGNDINNLGGAISSQGSIIQQAEGSITNKSLVTSYVKNKTIQSSGSRNFYYGSNSAPYNLKSTATSTTTATAIQQASISAKGDISQKAGNKIINVGSETDAGGNIIQTAEKGIENKNLLSSNVVSSRRSPAQQPLYYGYGYNNNRNNRNATPLNTRTTTQNTLVNSISAGGSLIAKVNDGDYLNQGNISANKYIEISANNITNTRQVIGEGNNARVVDSGKVTAGKNINFVANNNITDTAGRYDAKGNIIFSAKGNITQDVITISKNSNTQNATPWGYVLSADSRKSVTNTVGEFNAGGGISLQAEKDLTLTGSNLTAVEGVELKGTEINLKAARSLEENSHRQGSTRTVNRTVKNDVVNINSQGNVLVQATGNLTTQGSKITAGDNISNYLILNAGGDMTLEGVNDESYSYYNTSSSTWYGSRKSTIRESRNITLAETELTTAGSVLLNVDNDGMHESGNVTLVGTKINAGNDATLYAGGKLNILSGIEYSTRRNETHKSDFFGLSRSGSIRNEQEKRLGHAEIEADGNINLLSAGDINVVAGKITGTNIVADAGYGTDKTQDIEASVNIVGEKQALATLDHTYARGLTLNLDVDFFSFAEESHKRDWKTTENYIGSSLTARENLKIRANTDVNVIGSELTASNNLGIVAGEDINILAGIGGTSERTEETRDRFGIEVRFDGNGVDAFAGVEKRTVNNVLSKNNLESSLLLAGNQIQLNAEGNIHQLSSDVAAEGDINYIASNNIVIDTQLVYEDSSYQELIRRDGISASLHHNYENTREQLKARNKGNNTVSDVSGTLQDIDAIDDFISGPSASGFLGRSTESTSITESIGVTRGSVVQAGGSVNIIAKGDMSSFSSQILATDDITISGESVNILAVQDTMAQSEESHFERFGVVAAANKNNLSIGFGANFNEAEASYTGTGVQASILTAGNNIEINSNTDINVIGSDINAGNNISLYAINDITLTAKSANSDYSEDGRSGGAEVGIAATFGKGGAAVGVYGSLQMGDNKLIRNGTTYRNSHFAAGNNLSISSGRDTRVVGATVDADNLSVDVGGNLIVASIQDTEVADGRQRDISGRIVGGAGASFSASLGYGETDGNKNWVQEQTRLIGRKSVDVQVAGHTQLDGAVIANIDKDGIDNGNLTLSTGTFASNDIYDNHKETSYYLNVSVGTSTASDSNNGNESENNNLNGTVSGYYSNTDRTQSNLATLGKGNVVIRDNLNQNFSNLNRNINSAQNIIRDDKTHTDLYVSSKSIDSIVNYEDTWNRWGNDLKNYGKDTTRIYMNMDNMAKIKSDNEFINFMTGVAGKYNAIGNFAGTWSGGLVPSVENHGGLMAQVPVLATGDMFFYRVKVTMEYDAKLGKKIPKYKILREVERPKNNDYVATNGVFNSVEDAIRNGAMQTGSGEFIQAYNPQHGLVADALVESFWDVTMGGILPSGNARNLRDFYQSGLDKDFKINIAAHSQGGLLNYRAMDGLDFSKDGTIKTGTLLFSGAPVDSDDLYRVANESGFIVKKDPKKSNVIVQSNNNIKGEDILGLKKVDSVSVLLGFNFDSLSTFASGVVSFPQLFFDGSPHSNYVCQHNTCASDSKDATKAITDFRNKPRTADTNGVGYMTPEIYEPPKDLFKKETK